MKKALSSILIVAGALIIGTPAFAEFKPTKPIEVIVHTGPGGGADVLGRFMSQVVEKEKLAPVRLQVVNKPGGG
ncbi:MAG TPA: tripartite tricarboxylate transporter substrate binding protein, partial [Burkholderiales bacterium]|nr:tripartite tricarboxylate transporter substrate binding protein [Burkholderiales bacterium]